MPPAGDAAFDADGVLAHSSEALHALLDGLETDALAGADVAAAALQQWAAAALAARDACAERRAAAEAAAKAEEG